MQPSSQLCRAQEARQLALAGASALTNVRNVATLAAAAWAKEAVAAEKRESRKPADAATGLPLRASPSEDRALSENPDRGFAYASPIRTLETASAD